MGTDTKTCPNESTERPKATNGQFSQVRNWSKIIVQGSNDQETTTMQETPFHLFRNNINNALVRSSRNGNVGFDIPKHVHRQNRNTTDQ